MGAASRGVRFCFLNRPATLSGPLPLPRERLKRFSALRIETARRIMYDQSSLKYQSLSPRLSCFSRFPRSPSLFHFVSGFFSLSLLLLCKMDVVKSLGHPRPSFPSGCQYLRCRRVLATWVVEVCVSLGLSENAPFLAVEFMDRSFEVLGPKLNHISQRPRFQLVAVVCVCVCVCVRVQLENRILFTAWTQSFRNFELFSPGGLCHLEQRAGKYGFAGAG